MVFLATMSANSFGHIFRSTSFGESHGSAMGVVVDGCPSEVNFDLELLNKNLQRRRPGQSSLVTSRNEADQVEVLSGVFQGKTLGTPIAMMVRNHDQRSTDYEKIKDDKRIGHADDVWQKKFGHSDYRGGGRSSGRETVSRVMAGSVAQMFAQSQFPNLKIVAFATSVGPLRLSPQEFAQATQVDVDSYAARFPSPSQGEQVQALLEAAKRDGQSYGGTAQLMVLGAPAGLGQPVFRKLKADLASAMMSIGAVNGIELGSGFDASSAKGTDFHTSQQSSNYGGIRGGISTAEPILCSLSFKPTSSITDVAKQGRHDPYIVTRAIPVIEAMAWLVLADHILWSRCDRA